MDDFEESFIADIWLLSIESGMSGAVCNYDVIKDSCIAQELDYVEVYRVCKSMTNILNRKD